MTLNAHTIRKRMSVPEDDQVTGRRYGNGRRLPGTDRQVLPGKDRSGALMNILMSMCLGFIVLALALLVFWVLSQFDPLS